MQAFFLLLALHLPAASHAAAEPCLPADFSLPRAVTETVGGCFHSPSTKSPVHYRVTFPAGYHPAKDHPYAIFLHGRGSNGEQFRDFGGEAAIDQHLSKGGQAFVVVAPTEPRHSYWKNGPADEFGTARMVSTDLVKHLEAMPGLARGDRAQRAIIGISMGGHGSLYLAAKQPETFSAVYAMSPVFRGPRQLEPEDRAAFGKGHKFRAQDPGSLFRSSAQKGIPIYATQRAGVEMGKDDFFLDNPARTRRLLSRLQKSLGTEQVNFTRPGGHDAEYWRGALARAAEFLGDHFKGSKETTCAQRFQDLPLP